MKLRTSEYFLQEVFHSLKRNNWMTFASVGTVAVSLFVLGVFLILVMNMNRMAGMLESQVQISVYLEDKLEDSDHKKIKSEIENMQGIESVRFVSRDDAKEKLAERLQRVAAGERCGWPVYDRRLHDPVDNVITVDGDIVLLEGNYLLLGEPGWRDLRDFADYTVLIRANEDLLRRRLTDRKARGMATREEAEKFVKFSDMRNVRTCLEHSGSADLILEMTGDGEYRVVASKEKKVQGEKPAAVVRIWKAPKGVEARYVTLTECGQLIHAYRKLSDIRKDYRFEIRNNMIVLKRELDQVWQKEM